MVDGVNSLEVPVRKGDKREISLKGCVNKINVDVQDGMYVTFLGLAGLSSIRKSANNAIDYTSNVLGGFLFRWRLSLTPLLLLSWFAFVFCSSSVYFLVPVLLFWMSSMSWSYLVVV